MLRRQDETAPCSQAGKHSGTEASRWAGYRERASYVRAERRPTLRSRAARRALTARQAHRSNWSRYAWCSHFKHHVGSLSTATSRRARAAPGRAKLQICSDMVLTRKQTSCLIDPNAAKPPSPSDTRANQAEAGGGAGNVSRKSCDRARRSRRARSSLTQRVLRISPSGWQPLIG